MVKTFTIKITKEECETLTEINSTQGAEILDYEGEFKSLEDKGLVVVGRARGPANRWKRVELTEKGVGVLFAVSYKVVVEG